MPQGWSSSLAGPSYRATHDWAETVVQRAARTIEVRKFLIVTP
jgi:hypothetical protein